MRSLWRLRHFARGLVPVVLVAIPLMVGSAYLNVRAVYAVKPVMDYILRNAAPADRDAVMQGLIHQAGILLLLIVAAAGAHAASMYTCDYLGQNILRRLRTAIFAHLQTLSMSFFERRRSGELISRVNNDTMVLQRAMGTDLFKIVVAPLTIIFIVAKMIRISPPLTAVIAVALPIAWLVTWLVGRYARRYARRTQIKMADLTAATQETFAATGIIKTFGLEPQAQKRFDSEATGVLRAEMKNALVKALGYPPLFTLGGIATALTLVLGGYYVLNGVVTASDLIALMLLLQVAAAEATSSARLYVMMQNAEAAAERTLEVLAEPAEITDAPDAIDLLQVEGRISFDHAEFSYDGEHLVLRDFQLDIAPGEVVALAGPSGAGKSTVANLVPRLYDVQQGRVQIDGIDVRQIRQASLKRFMGSVPQETILFGTSVRENIGYGREGATEDEIVAAAKAAHAHDFIMELPEGYDTQVGERGTRLSGGQRQRIAIARAFLRNPRILILDEATSALDNESEAAVHSALVTLLQGRTALIIAHRLSTIRNADRIIVMDKGRIVEQGDHEELLQQDGLYRRLYESKELLGDAAAAQDHLTPAPTLAPGDDELATDASA